MGRHPPAVWQFSHGIARAPCGLLVVSRCGWAANELVGDPRNKTNQHSNEVNISVTAP
jgi:hypothetical protein